MSLNPLEWTWIQHMAVWPLTLLCLGVAIGFIALVKNSGSVHSE